MARDVEKFPHSTEYCGYVIPTAVMTPTSVIRSRCFTALISTAGDAVMMILVRRPQKPSYGCTVISLPAHEACFEVLPRIP